MKWLIVFFCSFLATLAIARDPASSNRVERIDIEPVWSAHPVGFCLLTHSNRQFVAYYDAQRRMTVGQRSLDSTNWSFTKLNSTLSWDSLNYVTMAVDRAGFLHVSGNMHCVPLIYFRSERPLDASSLKREPMTGEREQSVTYPVFMRDKSDRLIFRHRDGRSGNGDDLYNVYDEKSQTWSRLMTTPMMSGQNKMNAYASVPKIGPDGRFHMVWVWRSSPDCASNHDISYAQSDDLVTWLDSAGKKLSLPITQQTGDIVDPVPVHGGLINVNREVGFDNAGRAVVTYHKYDARGDLQAYAARHENGAWKIVQVSDWKGYRWNFSGGGTIVVEVSIGSVEPIGDGRLAIPYRYQRGSGTWVLDESTLRPIPGAKAPQRNDGLPPAVTKIESRFPGMLKKIAHDTGKAPAGTRFVLTWETLEANRDRPRKEPLPDPVMLSVFKIVR